MPRLASIKRRLAILFGNLPNGMMRKQNHAKEQPNSIFTFSILPLLLSSLVWISTLADCSREVVINLHINRMTCLCRDKIGYDVTVNVVVVVVDVEPTLDK